MDQENFLSKLKQQDHQAFQQLVQKYHKLMLAVVRPIVGDTWAEEVVQEAWVSAYKALPDFQERSTLKTWLFTIVKNEAFSRYRKESRQESLESHLPDDQQDQNLDEWLQHSFKPGGRWQKPLQQWDLSSPEALLQEEQLQQCIELTLELLKADQKAIFLLRDQEQMGMEEICNILEISHSNARVLLHRARMKLFQVINHYQDTGECQSARGKALTDNVEM
tara:strand:- start:2966 stop:3628 length:663 start_codon:yes stop_codon:yes gene_type:complete